MPKLKPWFHVVTPREDLRENRPLDASEFAVNLDLIRDGKARKDCQDPERFFERTYLTRNLETWPPRRPGGFPASRSRPLPSSTWPRSLVSRSGAGPILLSQETFLVAHIANGGPVPLSGPS